MVTIFNRAELTVTFDMSEQARIRSILAENGIDYYVKTVNLMDAGGTRSHSASFTADRAFSYQYYIYVRKQDLDKAVFLINQR